MPVRQILAPSYFRYSFQFILNFSLIWYHCYLFLLVLLLWCERGYRCYSHFTLTELGLYEVCTFNVTFTCNVCHIHIHFILSFQKRGRFKWIVYSLWYKYSIWGERTDLQSFKFVIVCTEVPFRQLYQPGHWTISAFLPENCVYPQINNLNKGS